MENPNNTVTHLSEEIVTEILARLPLRSISRFKSVCKTWKSILESLYFRRLFLSLHQSKSRSWLQSSWPLRYMIDFHRCQTWGLPKSLCYYFCNIFERPHNNITYKDSSNGLVLMEGNKGTYYVGNPILQQWVVLNNPILDPWNPFLVTHVDEDGVVLSFKVVTMFSVTQSEELYSTCMHFSVYSSDTGDWTPKQLHCPHYFSSILHPIITLHEMLYILLLSYDSEVIITHNFYGESNMCRVIPLPDPDSNNKRSLTTSTEFVIYIKTLPKNVLKVWRLVNDDDSPWELMWETRLEFISSDDNIISYAHVTVHPFDRNIVYVWSDKDNSLVSCNLKTQSYHIFVDQLQEGDLQNCLVNHSVCENHMDGLFALYLHDDGGINYGGFEYVFPRWMGSIPCPPQAEILDTTSLLSHITLKRKREN